MMEEELSNLESQTDEAKEQREDRENLIRQQDNLEEQDAQELCARLLEPNAAEAQRDYTEIVAQELKNLNLRRREYVKQYSQYLKSEEKTPFLEELKNTRQNYLEQKKYCAEILVAAKKDELQELGKTEEEVEQELQNYIRNEIFSILVLNEEKILQEQQAAEFPPKEKGVLRQAYEYWDNLSTVKKTLITTALATGLAFTSTTLQQNIDVALAGTALFFAKSFLVNLGQDLVSGLAGAGVNKILTDKIEKNSQNETENLKAELVLNNLNEISNKYHQVLEKKAQQSEAVLITSALTVIATGQACGLGLNWLSQTESLKNIFSTTGSVLEEAQDIMGTVGIAETVGKPSVGFFKKLAETIFRQGDNLD